MAKRIGFYNYFAQYYDLLDYWGESKFYHKLRAKFLSPIRNKYILEVGIGTGKNLGYYDSSNTIIGIDKSLKMLKEAQIKLHSDISLRKNNIKLKFVNSNPWNVKESSFDVVVATYVLCTQTTETIKPLLDQIHTVLKPKGSLILFEWFSIQNGVRGFVTKLISPILKMFLGPSAYRDSTLSFIQADNRWQIKKLYFLDPENYALILEKI